MLDLEKKIEACLVPNNCQLIIQETYQKTADFPINSKGSAKRQAEYLLSRSCLTECCKRLGYNFEFDVSGKNKQVILPADLIHSLSHSRQAAVAIVASGNDYQRLGVDLEDKNRLLTEKFINRTTTPLERKLISAYPGNEQIVATLIFSAKETVYKAFSAQINSFSYQNIEIWEEQGKLQAILINQNQTFPILQLDYGFYKQTHLLTCLIIPKY